MRLNDFYRDHCLRKPELLATFATIGGEVLTGNDRELLAINAS